VAKVQVAILLAGPVGDRITAAPLDLLWAA
jgi:hypothetical protein